MFAVSVAKFALAIGILVGILALVLLAVFGHPVLFFVGLFALVGFGAGLDEKVRRFEQETARVSGVSLTRSEKWEAVNTAFQVRIGG